MSLTPMCRGDAGYYEREVTRDLEAYFDGRGEEPGRWIGCGAAGAGLTGRVEDGQLAALFDEGCHPLSGDGLGVPFRKQRNGDRQTVTGYGLTFNPPKSVSVLWGLGDEGMHTEVRAGHDAAVAAAIGFLEEHAACSRRGKGGVFQVDTDGYVAAAFTHRTSRADDPQLHTHVLVSSKTLGVDGKWRSLDGREVFDFQKAAGGVYQAALRAELLARLGVAWQEVDGNGQADLVGVPQGLLEAFSARRRQVLQAGAARIAEREARLGRPLSKGEKAEQYQHAAYATRPAKRRGAPAETTLRDRWRHDAAHLGYPVHEWLEKTVRRTRGRRVGLDHRELVHSVLAELEQRSSTWSRADVAKAVAPRLPVDQPGGARAVETQMARLCDLVLADREVVRLAVPVGAAVPSGLCRADGEPTFERHGARRYTTRTTLRCEGRVLDMVDAGRRARAGVALPERVAQAQRDLGQDQVGAVRRLCLGGERIVCLVGPAGTGKTRTLAAASAAWAGSGIPVRGLAVSASAAEVLAAETGMTCDTVAKLLHEQDRDDAWRLRPGDVVVVDEASMLATRQLAELTSLVERVDGKLVLVGDPRQLGAVDAGGLFRLLTTDRSVTSELGMARRFTHSWEAETSLRLRRRDPRVLEVYAQHDRIVGGDRDDVIEHALERWAAARAGGRSVLVIAQDHATVDELAHRARLLRVAAGEVEVGGVLAGSQLVAAGDEIVTGRNDRLLRTTTGAWVTNGDRWTVTARTADDALAVASSTGKGNTLLPADYVAEHVALAYAVTAHKAQGVTIDEAVMIVDRATCAEHLYVGMTRGRHANHALVIGEPDRDDPDRADSRDPLEVLARALTHSGLEQSATQTLRERLAQSEDLALLYPLLAQACDHIDRRAGRDRQVELDASQRAAGDYHHAEQAVELAQARSSQVRQELDNLTTELAHAQAERVSAATRWHWWSRPDPAWLGQLDARVTQLAMSVERTGDELDRAHRQLQRQQQRLTELAEPYRQYQQVQHHMEQRQAWLEAHPVDVVWVNDLSRRIKARTDQLGVNAVNDEPDDLTKILGPVPPNPIGQDKWRQVAGHLEAYRERWHIQPGQLLDHRPERPEQTRHWRLLRETTIAYQRHAARQLDQTPSRKWQRDWYLEQEQARDRGIGPGLSR